MLALAEYGGFVAAAARLRVSQPALTRMRKRLETQLGVRLFERRDRWPLVPGGATRGPLVRGLRFILLAEPKLVRRLGLIALREREPTPAALGFMALLRREWPKSD